MARKSKDSRSPRNRLSQDFLQHFAEDFASNGVAVIKALREESPARYAELAGKLIMTAEEPDDDNSFSSCKTMNDIGKKLLKSVGVDEPSEEQISRALEANDNFVARLEEIAQGATNGRDS
jgi:hypothetical protein